jgi:hypothetical protein
MLLPLGSSDTVATWPSTQFAILSAYVVLSVRLMPRLLARVTLMGLAMSSNAFAVQVSATSCWVVSI